MDLELGYPSNTWWNSGFPVFGGIWQSGIAKWNFWVEYLTDQQIEDLQMDV